MIQNVISTLETTSSGYWFLLILFLSGHLIEYPWRNYYWIGEIGIAEETVCELLPPMWLEVQQNVGNCKHVKVLGVRLLHFVCVCVCVFLICEW